MKIKKVISRHRRDFRADYICEHCGHVEKDKYGYDDAYFHENVIPTMECSECGETSPSTYVYAANETKYPAHVVGYRRLI